MGGGRTGEGRSTEAECGTGTTRGGATGGWLKSTISLNVAAGGGSMLLDIRSGVKWKSFWYMFTLFSITPF